MLLNSKANQLVNMEEYRNLLFYAFASRKTSEKIKTLIESGCIYLEDPITFDVSPYDRDKKQAIKCFESCYCPILLNIKLTLGDALGYTIKYIHKGNV